MVIISVRSLRFVPKTTFFPPRRGGRWEYYGIPKSTDDDTKSVKNEYYADQSSVVIIRYYRFIKGWFRRKQNHSPRFTADLFSIIHNIYIYIHYNTAINIVTFRNGI